VLAEQASQNAAKVEEAYGGFAQRASNCPVFSSHPRLTWIRNPDVVDSDQESWTGIASPSAALEREREREREHEYSDEEQLATVTVVEDFDPTVLLYRAATTASDDDAELPAVEVERRPLRSPLPPPPGKASRSRSRKDDDDKKKKVVRYETKAARRATRATQRARRTEKAERAGGKAARRKAAGGKKPGARK